MHLHWENSTVPHTSFSPTSVKSSIRKNNISEQIRELKTNKGDRRHQKANQREVTENRRQNPINPPDRFYAITISATKMPDAAV